MARVAIRYELETAVERRVARDAKAMYGVSSVKMELRHDAGYPDRMFLLPGKPFWVEFKRSGDVELRPLQEHKIGILKDLGYDVEVHSDYNEAMAAIVGRLRNVNRRFQ
jgi:Asp-tRNA(Asn)/Glu-tRNA(Gln) amidotransferase A subunit family amidase